MINLLLREFKGRNQGGIKFGSYGKVSLSITFLLHNVNLFLSLSDVTSVIIIIFIV